MAINMREYLRSQRTFGGIAMKARAQSRATDRGVGNHQPREQTVRHVHVNEGKGQAVIADQFHNHTGGKEN
ncbi:MAG: hypothetical protein IPO97_10390, partial [Sphingomonadales bacterium]|nr:hypothetical protein [Sphingomonadales bacterium]